MRWGGGVCALFFKMLLNLTGSEQLPKNLVQFSSVLIYGFFFIGGWCFFCGRHRTG